MLVQHFMWLDALPLAYSQSDKIYVLDATLLTRPSRVLDLWSGLASE